MNPHIQSFFDKDSCTWTYLVSDPASGAAAVIDPVLDFDPKSGNTATASAQKVLDAARERGLRLEWILETHAHADHLSAGHWLRAQYPGARLAIGEGIRQVQATFREIFNLGEHFPVDGSQFDRLFRDGERFALGALDVEVIATPGHTNDSLSYRIGDAVFVGDTLFMPDGGSARCDFPGGSAATLFGSIQRLFALPDETRLFVCHDYSPGGRAAACETSVGAQRATNIHVGGGRSKAEFVAMREARDATLPMPRLILPSVQINIRAGRLPDPEDNGVRYLKLPLDRFPGVPV
ncbi:MAG: MBL fold metallo-hydrolase [Xanthomonadales bacterium]|nr:MBL fold metallo-hydrolase [Xanthomonadales bacterium]